VSQPSELNAGILDLRLPIGTTDLLKSIIRWAVELMRADGGEILLWDEERGALVQAISHGFIEVYDGVTLKPGEGMGGRVLQSGQPMLVRDYGTWEGRSDSYNPIPPFICTFAIPLKWQDEIVGVLAMDADSRRRAFDQNDIRLATLFANVATVAIKNAQLYEELQAQSQQMQRTLSREVAHRTAELRHRALQLETSARVSRQITSILEIDALLAKVVELIREAFDYYAVFVFLLEAGTRCLVLRAASGTAGQELVARGMTLLLNEPSLNTAAVRTDESLLINDVSCEPLFKRLDLLPDTRSELVIPLRVGERVIGTLDVQSDRLGAFQEEDLLAIQSLGGQIAIAIENARLYGRSQELAILEERTRLARELHDSVAQSLFSINLRATAVGSYLHQDLVTAEEELQELGRTADHALRDMRALIHDLRPVSLEEGGLVPALRREISHLRRAGGPEFVLQESGNMVMSPRVEQELFRIGQEALRNAVKHSSAQTITVFIGAEQGCIDLRVEDDGRGFDPGSLSPEDSRSFGLTGLRERIRLLDGQLEIRSWPEDGTRVRVRVPADAAGVGAPHQI
jgi:signal transduction histidine kinase